MNIAALHPLRIPEKWKVNYNSFFERIDPKLINDSEYEYRYDFCEDILQLQNQDITVDLGWYPEFSKEGYFLLQVISDAKWNDPIHKYISKDKEDIIEKVEYVLSHIDRIKDKNDANNYEGQWYCPVINKVVSDVDCYEISISGYGLLKKEALFVDIELDKWDHICDTCINNPDNK